MAIVIEKLAPKSESTKPAPAAKEKRDKFCVLFVCTGNTCRSPMAEAIFKDALKKKKLYKYYTVMSAGINAVKGSALSEYSFDALEVLGIPIAKDRRARMLTVEMCSSCDALITMTESQADMIGDNAVSFGKIAGRDIADPYGGSREVYLSTARAMSSQIDEVVAYTEKLRAEKH